MLKCVVIFHDDPKKSPDVKFSGEWMRKHVDVAYRCMMRELPKYAARTRKEAENVRAPGKGE